MNRKIAAAIITALAVLGAGAAASAATSSVTASAPSTHVYG